MLVVVVVVVVVNDTGEGSVQWLVVAGLYAVVIGSVVIIEEHYYCGYRC